METQTYRSNSSWLLHHLDPILRSDFSCRSGSMEKPILAVTDLLKTNLHMYKFAMTREFLAGKLDLPICSSCMVPGDLTFLLGNLWQESKGNIKFKDFTSISRFQTKIKNQFYLALMYSLSLLVAWDGSVEASHAMQREVQYSFVHQLSVWS